MCDGSLRAALLVLMGRGHEKDDIDCACMSDVLKESVKGYLDQVFEEWSGATGAKVGESWLREMLNAQCNEIGVAAANRYEVAQQEMRDAAFDAGVGYGG